MSSGNKSSMAALGVQYAQAAESSAQGRARYFNSANAFNLKLPEVPMGVFITPIELARRIAQTAWYACDQSDRLGSKWAATTPFMLARYGWIQPEETLRADFITSGLICYVIEGNIDVSVAGETLQAHPSDALLLPGICSITATATAPALVWVVTDEPFLAHHGLQPDSRHTNPAPVHFKSQDISRQIDLIYDAVADAGTSGMAVAFSCEAQEARRNLLPALTLSLNTMPPYSSQLPHRHNSAALTLVLTGEDAYSTVDGKRCDWSSGATLVTPAGAPHSHHNDGAGRADFLIVQDGGLYYEGRTMDFAFL